MKNKFKRASKPKKTTTLNRGNVLLRIWKTRKQVDSAACKIKSQFPICIARHSNGKLTVLNMEAANEKITMPQWKWRWLIRSLDGLVKYKLDIRLISGLELCVRAIRLYEANQVAALNSKKMEAAKLMGGVSTGLIPIGSLEYAVEAGLAIGIIEGLLSSGAASAGVKVLAEAVKMEDGIRASGKFFAIEEIVRIEQPIPNQWRKPYSRQIQVESPGFVGMKTESRTEHSAYIHIGDEFVCLSAEDQSVRCIRWSAVEQFVFNAKA